LILPIMLTTVMCVYLAERFQPHGVYMYSLHLQGIHLQQGRDVDVMQGVLVSEAMTTPAPVISENVSLIELRDALRTSRIRTLCVVNDGGDLVGIVTLSDLQGVYTATKGESELTVGDICTREVVTCAANDGLWTAIRIMGANDVGRLPVLDPSNGKLVGLIGRSGVMKAYNMAISRKLEDQHTAERVRLHALTGAHVFEVYVAPDAPIVGKHISEVHWPYESVVASIQRKGKLILPHGSTDLRVGDMLTVVADPLCANELWELAGQRPVSSLV